MTNDFVHPKSKSVCSCSCFCFFLHSHFSLSCSQPMRGQTSLHVELIMWLTTGVDPHRPFGFRFASFCFGSRNGIKQKGLLQHAINHKQVNPSLQFFTCIKTKFRMHSGRETQMHLSIGKSPCF